MKVIYYSKTFFSDCDFPLIKELRTSGVDVKYYLSIPKNFRAESVLEFDEKFGRFGFYKASKLHCFDKYSDCIDLDNLYIIAPYINRVFFLPGCFVWLYAIIHMILSRPDIIHITYHLMGFESLLLKFPIAKKKVMTVHDPFLHSGMKNSDIHEKQRKVCFKWADNLILLNKQQSEDFCDFYNISRNKIAFTRLGPYNSISKVKTNEINVIKPYIIYFGLISPYKGVEYLLEAMLKVHEVCPQLRLIIAGSGNLYFDEKDYKKLDFIEWRHRYIGISELIELVKNSEFSVCPYKDATQSGVIQTAYTLGCPVIATNVGALPEAVEVGKTGLLVPPCDVDALAESIETLFQNQNLLKSMKEYIKKMMCNNDSWKQIVYDYLNIYKV